METTLIGNRGSVNVTDSAARNFSYIAMVLSVSGRVRPEDLQMIAPENRAALLRSYFDANAASTPLYFDGENLCVGVATAAAPAPAPAPAAPVPVTSFEPPVASGVTQQAAPEEYAQSAYDLPVSAPASDYATPVSAYETPQESAYAPATTAAPLTPPAPPAPTPVPPVVDAPSAYPPPAADAAVFAMPEPKASGLFWLLPVFFSWLGGLVAFLIVRRTNAKQARGMLLLGIGLTVAYVLLTLALVALGGFALFSAGNKTITGSSVTTSTPVTTGTPAATSTAPAPKKKP